MKVQLWGYNFAPEPTGIAPVNTTFAEGLRDLGHQVEVVAAHPHYPEPRWGSRLLPYRENHDGIDVLRLPLWIGRETTAARMRQELTFTAALTCALPFLSRPDVIVAVSPSFPALLPAVMYSRAARVPLVPWLHDILPEGAIVTGHVDEGMVLRASRWLERVTYRTADRIVLLSAPFVDNLREKGVPESKLELIYDPATREPAESVDIAARPLDGKARVLCIGNIGHTQGLPPLVRAFDQSEIARSGKARLVLTGWGVAAEETKSQIEGDAVEMLGVVSDEVLERELQGATLAMVSQQYEGTEFNLPSKIMNYMAYGLPIVAAVNPASETARLVRESDAGWIADSSQPDQLPDTIAAALSDPDDVRARARAGLAFAAEHFTQEGFARRFETLLDDVVRTRG